MSSVPVITGLGLITPLGAGADATWSALMAGRFILDHARAAGLPAGPGRIFDLASAAAREAVAQARWKERPAAAGGTALVVGTSKGPVETWLAALPSTSDNPAGHPGSAAAGYGLASLAQAVRHALPLLDGPNLTLSAACASGLHALIRGAMMIGRGEADRVLVLAAEASVHPLFLASFRRLGVLPREGHGCRPYDRTRDGFLMSEAAAAICLERNEQPADAKPPQVLARVDRFAFGADATHLTGGDPAGETLRHLLRKVMDARPVDLIHGHGTGTSVNDPVELAALDDECSTCPGGRAASPLVYSHKAALGHSLGVAGLVSVALNCLMHRRGAVPPNVQTRDPLPARHVRIATEAVTMPVRRSLAAAAGFGGPMAVVSLVSP